MGSASARVASAALAPAVRAGLTKRVAELIGLLSPAARGSGLGTLAGLLNDRDPADLWLTHAVFTAQFPRPTEVRRLRRQAELDGGWAVIEALLHSLPHRYDPRFRPPVIAWADIPVIDVTGLIANDEVSAGVRIGRRLLGEWSARSLLPVIWAENGRTLRGLTADEYTSLGLRAHSDSTSPNSGPALDRSVVIPRAGYTLLGTVDLPRNAERLIALGQYAGFPTASVGYGIDELVHGERYATIEGAERFTWHLSAQRSFERLVAVGAGTSQQYSGWKRMLAAVGIPGPTVVSLDPPGDTAADEWQRFAADCATAAGLV